ncbi:MAG: AAA family ATPase, partial [Nereida ignava]
MAAPELKADPKAISDHLRHITRRWPELNAPCVFEIRFLTDEDSATVKDVSRYPASDQGIAQACDHIAAMNKHHLNAYVVVNPIDASAQIPTGKAAKDEHILASFFHWADGDDAQAADNIRSFVGPRPTFVVMTGTQPCQRPHVYWELEGPTRNLIAWNATQKAIAATLKTDASVVNASRIMRIGGTVNWPKPKKQAKGYIAEVTTFGVSDDRPHVSSERMARAFTGATPTDSNPFAEINTGTYDQKDADHYTDILRRARTDGEKHTGVRDLAASLAGSGVARHMAEAIIRDACPVWDEGVEHLIDTAYAKFYQPEPAVSFDHAPAVTPDTKSWQVQSAAEFTADFVAPEYLIDGVVQRGRLYTLTAPTGSGKTAVMLYIGTAMSRGMAVCDRETEAGDVIYMAGENPDDVRGRVIATMDAQEIDPREC